MAAEEKVEKIEKVEGVSGKGKVPAEEPVRLAPNQEHFDSLVNNNDAQSQKVTPFRSDDPSKGSLMDEVRNLNAKVDRVSKVTPKDIAEQANKLVGEIESVKKKLATPDLSLHPSTQVVLQNKLSHIDENLRTALSKAGIEYKPDNHLSNKSVNPVERFLGFLSNGQQQLMSMSTEMDQMGLNNKEITPANMLRIQMKMGYITQEIQFFSAVLNKALDSTKTIMNVQV